MKETEEEYKLVERFYGHELEELVLLKCLSCQKWSTNLIQCLPKFLYPDRTFSLQVQ
jgi:hypothetical protein